MPPPSESGSSQEEANGSSASSISKIIYDKYNSLCRDLNMDRMTEESAFKKYLEVSQRCTLEGEPEHWFCCALYATCRESATPTVGGPESIVMGNCVPLNNMLRRCNMSIYTFTTKMKQWAEVANLSREFIAQFKELERKFGITLTLCKKFKSIFAELFVCPPNERKNTKFSSGNRCSYNKLYDLSWRLFLSAKNHKPTSSGDLVTSYHMLVCCLDLIYLNVITEQRTDLINPKFKGLPKNWNTPNFDNESASTHCIIECLCATPDALPRDALNMKNNSWKETIKIFFDTNLIYGDKSTFLGIVNNINVDRNLKSLNSAYEQYVLSVGEFDERILANNRITSTCEDSNESGDRCNEPSQQEMKPFIPDTPYTRQQLLPRQENIMEPVANATYNVKQLQAVANIEEPTNLIRNSGSDVVDRIYVIRDEMMAAFCREFSNSTEAANRFQLAMSLYYYLLDNIVRAEYRMKQNLDLKSMLKQDMFNKTLMSCCVGLVLEAYGSQQKFPWILDCFHISAFHFLKIIESVVLHHHDVLTRELVKHLNAVEETCLEELAWLSTSPVWDIIRKIFADSPLPTWKEVGAPNAMPSNHSPNITAYESFNATPGRKTPPQQYNISDGAKRDLFNATNSTAEANAETRDEQPTTSKPTDSQKRTGPLHIFLRKFYKLAWLRMSKLCNELSMSDSTTMDKIWTMFEYSITQRTKLMCDRHLDQILMCAIYIFIKVTRVSNKTFRDIMTLYRNQPQATSMIYRNVFCKNENGKPEYMDIIHFYNTIYVPQMEKYSMNFREGNITKGELLLSPHPQERQTLSKQVTQIHKLYVSQMPKNGIQQSPNQLFYEFCKSPAKDLRVMNEKVSGGKRSLFGDVENEFERKRTCLPIPNYMRKVTDIMHDRKK